MKNITNKSIEKDLNIINNLFHKYNDAIWEGQEGQSAHYDNQTKLVKLGIRDIVTGLNVTRQALAMLNNIGIEEDKL